MSVQATRSPASRQLLVAIGDKTLRKRVLSFVGGLADATDDIESLLDIRTNSRIRGERIALIVGNTTASGATSPGLIQALRAQVPLMPVVLCSWRHEIRSVRLAALARAGIDDIVLLDGPFGEIELRTQVRERLKHALPFEIATLLEPSCALPASRAVTVESWCTRNAYRPLRAGQVADYFGVNRKTLYRSARDAGWRDLHTVFGYARLLHVAVALEYHAATIDRISSHLAFGSPAALHKFVRRYTGRTPVQLRQTDAVGFAAALWRSRGREPRVT